MSIRNNESASVSITTPVLGPITPVIGSLTGDILNVVSPSFKGPAFVPKNLNSKNSVFDAIGNERQNMYGHLYDELHYYTPNQGINALNMWFDNGGANAVHTRILGIGDGIKNELGTYNNSGFRLKENENIHFVFSTYDKLTLSTEYGKELLSEFGVDLNKDNYFLSKVIFTPNDATALLSDDEPTLPSRLFVNYSRNDVTRKSAKFNLTANLQIDKPKNSRDEFRDNLFNTEYEEDNHFVYCNFGLNLHNAIFKTKIKSVSDNVSIDYKDFEDKYQTALTPWVTSQPLNRTSLSESRLNIQDYVTNLFRFHALDDGEVGNRYKIKINPKSRGNENLSTENYSLFDVYIFEYDVRDNSFLLLETYEDLNLNVDDLNYIGRRIGTRNKYFDLQTSKIYEEGKYENVSRHIRVEINEEIENKTQTKLKEIVPSGFRAYHHVDCSSIVLGDNDVTYSSPVQYYRRYNNVSEIDGLNNTWGVQMYSVLENGVASPNVLRTDTKIQQENSMSAISPHYYHTKFFVSNRNDNKNVWKQDDSYLNSFFHLEKIIYNESTYDNSSFKYKHSGSANSKEEGLDYLNLDTANFDKLKNKLSFDLFTYGGFDGTNILSKDKKYMTNKGLLTEYYIDNIHSIYNSYVTGTNQTTRYENCGGTILVLPDISTNLLHSYCVEKVESLTRYIYIADILDMYIDFTNNLEVVKDLVDDFYVTEKTLSNYLLDESLDIPYEFSKSIDKINNLLTYNINTSYDSKYLFNVLGNFTFNILLENNRVINKNMTSSSFVCGLFANQQTLSKNITRITPIVQSNLGVVSDFNFIDILKDLRDDFESNNKEKIKNKLFNLNINAFTSNSGINNTNVGLLTSHTNSGSEFTINRRLNIVRTIQFIKNSIMIDLYTNTEYVEGTVLFNNSSKLNSIRQKIKIQLTNLMNSFVSSNLITGYKINISDDYNNNFNDVVNNILRGNIIIQFGQSNIIELDIDNILLELNGLLDSNSNTLTLPRVI